MTKVLIEIEKLPDGGFKAQRMEIPQAETIVLKAVGCEIYAEKITTGAAGLTGRLHKRLIEIFKP